VFKKPKPNALQDWELRVALAWDSDVPKEAKKRIKVIEELAHLRDPNDPIAIFERACAQDSFGSEFAAESLYREALANKLSDVDTYRAVRAHVQLASTLRNLNRVEDAVQTLKNAKTLDMTPEQQAWVRAFELLLNLTRGLDTENSKMELGKLIPALTRYQRSLNRFILEF
jgi:tetratricopeptide (TPR) repeat protein